MRVIFTDKPRVICYKDLWTSMIAYLFKQTQRQCYWIPLTTHQRCYSDVSVSCCSWCCCEFYYSSGTSFGGKIKTRLKILIRRLIEINYFEEMQHSKYIHHSIRCHFPSNCSRVAIHKFHLSLVMDELFDMTDRLCIIFSQVTVKSAADSRCLSSALLCASWLYVYVTEVEFLWHKEREGLWRWDELYSDNKSSSCH